MTENRARFQGYIIYPIGLTFQASGILLDKKKTNYNNNYVSFTISKKTTVANLTFKRRENFLRTFYLRSRYTTRENSISPHVRLYLHTKKRIPSGKPQMRKSNTCAIKL